MTNAAPNALRTTVRVGAREVDGAPRSMGVVVVVALGAALLTGAAVLATTITRETHR